MKRWSPVKRKAMDKIDRSKNIILPPQADAGGTLDDLLEDPPPFLRQNNPLQSSASNIIEVRNLTKTYGKQQAVSQVSFQIETGAIYGFIGPNGAGKTTTLGILATLLEPTSGEALICGVPVSRRKNHWEIRRLLGYMPDGFGTYERLRVWEYLDFYATAYHIPRSRRKALITDLLSLFDLTSKRDTYTAALSHGMKQRLGLARCLVHDPKLLLLDEPANGLDPRARIELRELLRELSRMGKTIIISSHILTELSEVCTHAGIIERGQMLVSGRISDILNQSGGYKRRVRAKFKAPAAHTAIISQILAAAPRVGDVQSAEADTPSALAFEFNLNGDEQTQIELLRYLVTQNLPLYALTEEKTNLEDIFMRITKGAVA